MNKPLLQKHLKAYKKRLAKSDEQALAERDERAQRTAFYRSWTAERILGMSEEDLYKYVAKLWAMQIWGNKKYVVDKLIAQNGLETVKENLAELLWGKGPVRDRWDRFRSTIKGMGPAMMSELLCQTHPDSCMLWNRRAYVGLNHLEVQGLPRHDYQLTGEKYEELSQVTLQIAAEMQEVGLEDSSLLAVDYFIWSELQVEDNLTSIHKRATTDKALDLTKPSVTSDFVHNDVRDKLAEIGEWLGFKTRVEIKVAEGSKVDTIWESTIGNMGRVIYVFEVQTKGSIDSLLVNLLKALKNPAVQGVVAVSDADQIQIIKKHAADVSPLADKLRYWDYAEVLDVHEKLSTVNEVINQLKLVPEPF